MGTTIRETDLGSNRDDDQRRQPEEQPQKPFQPGQTNAPQPKPTDTDKKPEDRKPTY